jgi:hypothetical protein
MYVSYIIIEELLFISVNKERRGCADIIVSLLIPIFYVEYLFPCVFQGKAKE